MNIISKDREQTGSRVTRGVGAAVLSAVLVAGLAGCMTGKVAEAEPAVQRDVVVPAGVDRAAPADRIEQQLARQAAANRADSARYAGRPADRIAEEIERNAGTAPVTTQHLPSWTDRIVAQIAHDAATPKNPAPGMTADRLDRFLDHAQ